MVIGDTRKSVPLATRRGIRERLNVPLEEVAVNDGNSGEEAKY
jgi:hypothetical protein